MQESLCSLQLAVEAGGAIDTPVERISIFDKYKAGAKLQGSSVEEKSQSETNNVVDVSATSNSKPLAMSSADILKYSRLAPDKGRKLTLDNIDIHQVTHDMTEEYQNPDAHD